MSGQHPPLSYKDVVRLLLKLGFKKRPTKGTSHEQWVRSDPPPFRKVTVDKNDEPYDQFLISSMASQAGLTKKQFYAAVD